MGATHREINGTLGLPKEGESVRGKTAAKTEKPRRPSRILVTHKALEKTPVGWYRRHESSGAKRSKVLVEEKKKRNVAGKENSIKPETSTVAKSRQCVR